MFFQLLMRDFALVIAAILYVACFWPTVKRFYDEVISVRRADTLRLPRHFLLPVKAIIFFALFFAVPYLIYSLRARDCEEKKRIRKEELEQSRVTGETKQLTKEEENDDWLNENPIVLFFHTMNGITSVLNPIAYESCKKVTRVNWREGRWIRENALLPSKEAYIFVNESGRKLFIQNHGTTDPIKNKWISGLAADLDDLVDCYGIELVQKLDIFVPYVNESILPFSQQAKFLNENPKDYVEGLVVKQFPGDNQPT